MCQAQQAQHQLCLEVAATVAQHVRKLLLSKLLQDSVYASNTASSAAQQQQPCSCTGCNSVNNKEHELAGNSATLLAYATNMQYEVKTD
jgi:hypothetical protein